MAEWVFKDEDGNRYVELAYPQTFTILLKEGESPAQTRKRMTDYVIANPTFLTRVMESAAAAMMIVQPAKVTRKHPQEECWRPDDLEMWKERK
jgi:hypothetical protein